MNSKGATLEIDGLWGTRSQNAWEKYGPNGQSSGAPQTPTSSGWMPNINHVPRWNHSSRPALNAKGIVLHRTAGYFSTGDYAVGKWGNYRGQSHKGSSLGFHFLLGEEEGEWIQFCSIKKHVSHVRVWSSHYVGIEFSGDVGQYRDGYKYGEDLTDWQIKKGVQIIKWITGQLGIPRDELQHQSKMFQHDSVFHGLLGHRDLSGNTHADSPNKGDWARIMGEL
ncbi:MAG: N-acetylmuramoyl-L-alanine amidase [Verrucomicrobiales bacterium]|nr:N-acetylmuramoyl-L-alanine amidase [Verrucomicrobiales bacterium]